MPPLVNPKHEFFAHELAYGKTQIEAYALAGYKEDHSNACNLANRADVQLRIHEITAMITERAQVKADRVLAELARIGFSDITEAVQIVKGKVKITDTANMPPSIKAAIAEISQGRDGLKVKFHNKPAALEALGKHLGLFKENINLDVNISLADLVNGSYKLDGGEITPAAPAVIEHKPQEDQTPDS